MTVFKTEEVADLCGLPVHQIIEWVKAGLEPADDLGPGRGKGRRFSRMQAVGLVVAAELHRSDRGCRPKYAAAVVEAFEKLGESGLSRVLASRDAYFAFVGPSGVVTSAKHAGWPDVNAAHRKVQSAITGR